MRRYLVTVLCVLAWLACPVGVRAQSSFYQTVCDDLTLMFMPDSDPAGWTVEAGGAPGSFAATIRAENGFKYLCTYWWNDGEFQPTRTICDTFPATHKKFSGGVGPKVAASASRHLADGTWQVCVTGPVTITPGLN